MGCWEGARDTLPTRLDLSLLLYYVSSGMMSVGCPEVTSTGRRGSNMAAAAVGSGEEAGKGGMGLAVEGASSFSPTSTLTPLLGFPSSSPPQGNGLCILPSPFPFVLSKAP